MSSVIIQTLSSHLTLTSDLSGRKPVWGQGAPRSPWWPNW